MIMQNQNNQCAGQSRLPSSKCGKTNPPDGATTPESDSGPSLEYCKQQLSQFLPIKPPANWDERQDFEGFIEIWGESDHPWADSEVRLARSLNRLHAVLRAGIEYFAEKRKLSPLGALAIMSLSQRVALFTDLLPVSVDDRYALRFTLRLSRILWLESERERLARNPTSQQWLFPLYTLADEFMGEACLLEEAMRCEHDDFDASRIQELEDSDC